jgi:hypothetical protein
MNRSSLAVIGVIAGALTIVGAIGPWATLGNASVAGTDANRGVTVAVAGGVGLLLMAVAVWKGLRWAMGLAAVAGLIAAGLTIWSLAAINKFAGVPSGLPIGKGWGIWIATIASIVLAVIGIVGAVMKDQGSGSAVEAPPETTPS